VEFTFSSTKLAKLCSSHDQMVRQFGLQMARRLEMRLQQLEAAASLADLRQLPQVRAHELIGNRDEQISLDLVHPFRLILQVANDPVPRLVEGGLDWGSVTSVTVLEVTDTHG
jgi:proteic killer suppression protein